MRLRSAIASVLVSLLVAAACGRSAVNSSAPKQDLNLISQADLVKYRFQNAYEALSALRSNWLNTRGPDSFSGPSQVVVYRDAIRLGGIETLRTIPIGDIGYIRHLDGVTATGRYGMGHAAGVILISAWRKPPQDNRDSTTPPPTDQPASYLGPPGSFHRTGVPK